MREQSHVLHRRGSRDKKVENCEGGARSGISKWRSDHKQPCPFAFLTGVGGLRVQYGSRKGKSHQIYLIFFLDRVTRLLDERTPLPRYTVDKNGWCSGPVQQLHRCFTVLSQSHLVLVSRILSVWTMASCSLSQPCPVKCFYQ